MESVVSCRQCYVHVGAVSRFEFGGDIRTNWLKLVRGTVGLRCDYQAEYTNTLRGEMRCCAGLVLIQVLEYTNHCAVEERNSFIIVSSFCRRMF